MTADTVRVLQEWFGVELGSARLAAALFEQNGRWMNKTAMVVASGRSPADMALCLKQLRAAMEPGAVGFAAGAGYRMTEVGLADCRRGLEDAAAREKAA